MVELDINNLLGDKYPNASFHDAEIHAIHLDYVAHEAWLACELDTDFGGQTGKGTLHLTGLLYFVIEPPHAEYPFEDSLGIEITGDGSVATTDFKGGLPALPKLHDIDAEAAFVNWLYVVTWNACIFFAATGARFEWHEK